MVQSGGFHTGKLVLFMFMGEYNHTIDSKGRLIVPSRFRDSLGDNFVVTKGLDGCLLIYGNPEWTAFEEQLKTLPTSQKATRQFVRFFLAGACEAEVDKQGRILLPQNLREFAKLDKDVVLVGVGKNIEIWDKASYDADAEQIDLDRIEEQMAEYNI